jgi:D-alanine transaminase
MPEVVYLNGKRIPREEACVSIDDRGFLFGDAVYEVLRAYGGRLWAAERHFRRLARSLREVLIEGVDVAQVQALTAHAVEESGFLEAHVYLHITRGLEPRALAYQDGLVPTVLIHVRDIRGMVPAHVCEGVSAITVPDLRWKRCDIKSTNLLANALARKTAKRAGSYEAIMYDAEGFITEAAAMSVFAVEGDVLLTTPLSPAILPSISRELLLEMAGDLGITAREERIARARLAAMDEIFLTSTMHEVCPVTQLDGAPVGAGQAGPIATRLSAAFHARLAAGDDAPRVAT